MRALPCFPDSLLYIVHGNKLFGRSLRMLRGRLVRLIKRKKINPNNTCLEMNGNRTDN